MTRKLYFESLMKKCGKVLQTLQKKGADYTDRESDNPFENYELAADVTHSTVEQVMISRVVEKLVRVTNLVKLENNQLTPAVEESIEDCLQDCVGIILMCWQYRSLETYEDPPFEPDVAPEKEIEETSFLSKLLKKV